MKEVGERSCREGRGGKVKISSSRGSAGYAGSERRLVEGHHLDPYHQQGGRGDAI